MESKGRIADAVIVSVLVRHQSTLRSIALSGACNEVADGQDQLHAPLVEAFAKQGYHILCEKPMATSIDECVDMVKQVQASDEKKIFGVGHGMSLYVAAVYANGAVLRYSPYNRAVKQVIDSGALGEIINIQVSHLQSFPKGRASLMVSTSSL